MKTMIYPILVILFFMESCKSHENQSEVLSAIRWHGQACVSFNHQGIKIYIDPYQLHNCDSAGIILITHPHGDHCSPEDLKMISGTSTVIIAPAECRSKLAGIACERIIESYPGFKTQISGITIEAVPAYNVIKKQFHDRDHGWVGYILTIDGVRVYHTGDTERIPEMKNIRCDIVLVPLGQVYTMNSVEEALEVCLDVKARVAIPIHYGLYEGTPDDAQKFKELAGKKTEVIILTQQPN